MPEKSRFLLNFDHGANAVNRRPNLLGEYRLAGEQMARHELSLWGGTGQNGKLYARGHASPESAAEALRASAQGKEVEAPPFIDLKVGEAVLFENPSATEENRRPKYFGYAREPNRYVRLSGWERGHTIAGTAEPYRPSGKSGPLPPLEGPIVKG
jgi:hypothetical protein